MPISPRVHTLTSPQARVELRLSRIVRSAEASIAAEQRELDRLWRLYNAGEGSRSASLVPKLIDQSNAKIKRYRAEGEAAQRELDWLADLLAQVGK